MSTPIRHIAPYTIRLFLMLFWLYVAVDKLWDLEAFRAALIRQPFPDGWAGMLYWSLPLAELAIALLFIINRSSNRVEWRSKLDLVQSPYFLSAALLCIFSTYIALGLAGFYAQRPCGCASVFGQLNWNEHLMINILLLALSILGWYLTGPTSPMEQRKGKHAPLPLTAPLIRPATVPIYGVGHVRRRRFPRRHALFPAGPVLHKPKVHVCFIPSKMQHAIHSPTIPEGRATVYT